MKQWKRTGCGKKMILVKLCLSTVPELCGVDVILIRHVSSESALRCVLS